MQKIQRFQPGQLVLAFKQAPWRVETQVIAALAAILVVVIAIRGRYLAEASRAAVAGRAMGLVDDVFTSGSTLAEAARTLQAAGARVLLAVVVCVAHPGEDQADGGVSGRESS